MKKVFTVALLLFSTAISTMSQAQPAAFNFSDFGVRIEPDKRLIVVLASLEAAGIQTKLTERGEIFRAKIRQDLAGMNEDVLRRIKLFFEQYKRRHPKLSEAEMNASFVSLAFALSPVPELADPRRTDDLPGDLLEVFDYAPLVREFYRRSGIDAHLAQYVAEYQQEGDKFRPSAKEMMGDILSYLHTRPELIYYEAVKTQTKSAKGKAKLQRIEQREHTRRFFIVPELLSVAGTVNFRNVGDDYYAVIPPDTDLSRSEIRRAFIQFVVDVLVTKNSKDVAPMKDGIRALLEERRKAGADVSNDIYLAVSRSLVAAIDARELEFRRTQYATTIAREKIDRMKTPEAKKAVAEQLAKQKESFADETALELSEAYEGGAVLSFHFANQLKGFEDSGFNIEGSIREMILSIDLTKEPQRLAETTAARKRAEAAREQRKQSVATNREPAATETNPLTKGLQETEDFLRKKDFAGAEISLKKLSTQYPDEPRVFYAIGRFSSLLAQETTDEDLRNRRLGDAAKSFSAALNSPRANSDHPLMSLSYVALARIYEYLDRKTLAIKIYEAAIRLGEQTGGAYFEAVSARARLLKEQ